MNGLRSSSFNGNFPATQLRCVNAYFATIRDFFYPNLRKVDFVLD